MRNSIYKKRNHFLKILRNHKFVSSIHYFQHSILRIEHTISTSAEKIVIMSDFFYSITPRPPTKITRLVSSGRIITKKKSSKLLLIAPNMMAIGLMELRAIYPIVVGWQYTFQSELERHHTPALKTHVYNVLIDLYYCMTRLWLTSHKKTRVKMKN